MGVTNKLFAKRSQYISIKNHLHKQSEKACMCFKTRWASTRDYTSLDYMVLNNAIQCRVGKGVKKPELEETSFMDGP